MTKVAPKGRELPRRYAAACFGVGVGLFVLVLYLRTLAPTVLYYDRPEMFDSAMLQAAAPVLGIGHPTGYPTYMMLAKLFTYLPFGDAAYRVNLLSAVFGAVAVTFVYLAGLRLSRRPAAAAAGALAFGLTPIFWSQAVIAEVYTLNATFVALVVYLLLRWRDGRKDRQLLLAVFFMGLALTNHLTSALLLSAALVFAGSVNRSILRRPRLLLKGAGLFAAGLLPYVYLPVRAVMEAPLNEADPSTPERFLTLVTGGNFLLKLLLDAEDSRATGGLDGSGYENLWAGGWQVFQTAAERLSPTGEYVGGQFPALLLLVGAAGAIYLAVTDRPAALGLGLSFVGWSVHALTYTVEDFYVFFIPAYLVFGLFVAAGAGVALGGAERLTRVMHARERRIAAAAVALIMLAAPLAGAPATYAAEDRSEDYRGSRLLDTVAEKTERGATVLHHRSSLWYMVLVQERRTDLTLIDPFETSWVRYTDMVWPESVDAEEAADRYGTDDTSGIEAARRAAAAGAVYLLDQDVDGVGDFRDAGFSVRPVGDRGELYKLVPQEEESRAERPASRAPSPQGRTPGGRRTETAGSTGAPQKPE